MVSVGTGEICVYKYCGIYDISIAVCYYYRSTLFYLFPDPYDLFSGTVFRRLCSRGIYDIVDGTAVGWKCYDDQSGNHRILYCQDL